MKGDVGHTTFIEVLEVELRLQPILNASNISNWSQIFYTFFSIIGRAESSRCFKQETVTLTTAQANYQGAFKTPSNNYSYTRTRSTVPPQSGEYKRAHSKSRASHAIPPSDARLSAQQRQILHVWQSTAPDWLAGGVKLSVTFRCMLF